MIARGSGPSAGAVDAATLPLFTNMRAQCRQCGGRRDIRVHYDSDCALVHGSHFHRLCPCGHRWVEQATEHPTALTLAEPVL